jgi:glycerophosphoryl diester phosphodiesterase
MSRPLLLGHRGLRLSGQPRENTISAFDSAMQQGCDGFEFDVRRTADDQAVICHDAQFEGVDIATASHLRVQGLCSLGEVLKRYARSAFLDIELKVPGLEQKTVTAIQQTPPQCGFVISSFDRNILIETADTEQSVPLGFICERQSALGHWRDLPVDYVIPHLSLLRRELLHELHRNGKKVIVWTVNDLADMMRFSDWGVDGIISDDPALLVRTVGRGG